MYFDKCQPSMLNSITIWPTTKCYKILEFKNKHQKKKALYADGSSSWLRQPQTRQERDLIDEKSLRNAQKYATAPPVPTRASIPFSFETNAGDHQWRLLARYKEQNGQSNGCKQKKIRLQIFQFNVLSILLYRVEFGSMNKGTKRRPSSSTSFGFSQLGISAANLPSPNCPVHHILLSLTSNHRKSSFVPSIPSLWPPSSLSYCLVRPSLSFFCQCTFVSPLNLPKPF